MVGEGAGMSGSLLEACGYRVERAMPKDAIGRAHDLLPDVVVFHGREATDVARTLGWIHDVPMLFVGAGPREIADIPRSTCVVASPERLPGFVRNALIDS